MEMSKGKMVSYYSILLIICICTFLTAKYIVRSKIDQRQIPIDTSTRI